MLKVLQIGVSALAPFLLELPSTLMVTGLLWVHLGFSAFLCTTAGAESLSRASSFARDDKGCKCPVRPTPSTSLTSIQPPEI